VPFLPGKVCGSAAFLQFQIETQFHWHGNCLNQPVEKPNDGFVMRVVSAFVSRRVRRLAGTLIAVVAVSVSASAALAKKVDPEWAAGHLKARAPEVLSSTTTGVRQVPLPQPRPKDVPVITGEPKVTLARASLIRGIRITPASADWKMNGLKHKLVRLMVKVQNHFGRPLHIVSGCRSRKYNRRIGGARRSQHLYCKAVDFSIPGVSKYRVAKFLRRLPGRGGVGLYCRSSYVHLDIGPRRQWSWSCGKRKRYKKKRSRTRYVKNRSRNRKALRENSNVRSQRSVTRSRNGR
jgi:hypothetical protein